MCYHNNKHDGESIMILSWFSSSDIGTVNSVKETLDRAMSHKIQAYCNKNERLIASKEFKFLIVASSISWPKFNRKLWKVLQFIILIFKTWVILKWFINWSGIKLVLIAARSLP